MTNVGCRSANRADYIDCGREATGEDPEAGVCDYPFSCPIGRTAKCALVPGTSGTAECQLDDERISDYDEHGPAGADVDDWRARERV